MKAQPTILDKSDLTFPLKIIAIRDQSDVRKIYVSDVKDLLNVLSISGYDFILVHEIYGEMKVVWTDAGRKFQVIESEFSSEFIPPVYGVLNEEGKKALFDHYSINNKSAPSGRHSVLLSMDFPWAFEQQPEGNFLFGKNQMGAGMVVSSKWFTFYKESELPFLIQKSFERFSKEYQSRFAHDWRNDTIDLFELLWSLNKKESANGAPITKALLLNYDKISSGYDIASFKMQTAYEQIDSLVNANSQKVRTISSLINGKVVERFLPTPHNRWCILATTGNILDVEASLKDDKEKRQ